ncbi:hypothetical protein [Lutibaculum baratangense]|nr:hypothetical protein [Lutibaculum baratangense]
MNFRNTALAGSMIVVLGLAACGEDDQTAEAPTENEQVVVEESTTDAPATEEMAATDEPELAEETATAEAPAVEEETVAVENTAPAAGQEQTAAGGTTGGQTDVATMEPQSDGAGSDALAELEGRWAESEEQCGTTEIAFAQDAITLPEGMCEIQSTEVGDGTLNLQVACGGDAGTQDWTVESAQGDASADEITLDRAAGGTIDLVRCEG